MDAISRLDARHLRKWKYLKKVLEEFAISKVARCQDGGRLYGLFSVILDLTLTNGQKAKTLEEESCVIKKYIDDMVSLFMQIGSFSIVQMKKNRRKGRW